MKSRIIFTAIIIGVILVTTRLLGYQFMDQSIGLEFYLGAVGLIFLLTGLYAGIMWQQRVKKHQEAQGYEWNEKNDLLSDREMEVLKLLAEGLTNKEISEKLYVSVNTVKTHLNNIYSKLGVNRRTQAISAAKRLEILK
jgi:DNA-binding CsgD family transcriptional regulator